MDLKEKLIEALDSHTQYLQELTEYIRKDLMNYAKEVQEKKQENYQKLVLIIGYTAYFTTWFQLKDIFCKSLMNISYAFMVGSVAITVLTLMIIYLIELIKNNPINRYIHNKTDSPVLNNAVGDAGAGSLKPKFNLIEITLGWLSNMAALFFGFASIVCIIIASICWVCK